MASALNGIGEPTVRLIISAQIPLIQIKDWPTLWRAIYASDNIAVTPNFVFVVGYEEPTLKKSFGAEYEAFRINVPRWIPRLTAWRGGR